MSTKETQDIAVKATATSVVTQQDIPLGFSEDDSDDIIIPRVKIVQSLSPERKDKVADEGDIINSLTKEKLNGKVFIPVFKFNNNIDWKDRADGGGMQCVARDGKVGESSTGQRLLCASCKRCEFDNSKQGKDAAPKCTKYINFFGFFAGEKSPIILSFAKTNYGEGKKLYSLAKVTMQNMWNYSYILQGKLISKNSNEWYNIITTNGGTTADEDRAFAMSLYKSYSNMGNIAFDVENSASTSEYEKPVDVNSVEY